MNSRASWLSTALAVMGGLLLWRFLSDPSRQPAAAGSSPGAVEVVPHLQEVTYEIYGTTADQLMRGIRAVGPTGVKGATAEHQGRLGYTLTFRSTPLSCSVHGGRIDVHSTIKLPRWRHSSAASAGLREEWVKVLAALKVHEQGHRDILFAASRQLADSLGGLRSRTCDGLDAKVNEVAARLFAREEARQEQYDAETEHGIRQGAVLHEPADAPF